MKLQWGFHRNRVKKLIMNNIRPKSKSVAPAFLFSSLNCHVDIILACPSEEDFWNEPWMLYSEMGITQYSQPAHVLQAFFPTPAPTPMDLSAVSIISNIIPPLSCSLFLCFPRAAPIMNNLQVWRKKSVTTGVSRLITHKPVTWSRVTRGIIFVKRNYR